MINGNDLRVRRDPVASGSDPGYVRSVIVFLFDPRVGRFRRSFVTGWIPIIVSETGESVDLNDIELESSVWSFLKTLFSEDA